jgi:hypothetical protein
MVPTILMISDTPTTSATVGAGFSGSLVATHLLKTANRPLLIKLIERAILARELPIAPPTLQLVF